MQTIRSFVALLFACCALPVCAAPFEVKIHDELIAPHQEYSFEAEVKLYKPPLGGAIKSSVVQSRFELAKGMTVVRKLTVAKLRISISLSMMKMVGSITG